MPLHLSSSNRIETLQLQLADLLSAQPLADPFAREVVLVPTMALQRWLNLQIAGCHGVAANIDCPLPAAWIWKLAAQLLDIAGDSSAGAVPQQDPLSRESSAWKIYGVLPALLQRSEFLPLLNYLQDDDSGVKRWQLSERIADAFDRYQYYRPDWIRDWSAPEPRLRRTPEYVQSWQPILWRELISDCADTHRVALIDQLLQTLLSEGGANRLGSILPERLSCFALSSLPPLFVEVLNALARHVDVYLFQHSPTDQYWADLRSKKSVSRLRVENAEVADYYDTGNELLASWGRQGQSFQDLLLSSDALESAQWEEYCVPGEDTLLHRLQGDILALREERVDVAIDESIQVSICHSPLRECQVLHDRLLRELQQDRTLKAEDILVVIPEISRYAPYIDAVFRRDESGARPFIPWNLSDIAVADEHPLIRIFFQLLALPGSRFTHSEVTSYISVPEIAEHFHLDASAQEEVLSLLQQSQVRWALDGEHKRAMGLPAIEQNTWLHASDRLMVGYAMGEIEFWNGIAPVEGVGGGRAGAVGNFLQLLEALRHWHGELQRTRTAREWQLTLQELLSDIFGDVTDEDDKLQQIRDAIAELREQAGDQLLSPELLSLWLTDSLGTRTVHNRFFSGGITFCGMRPMRSLPFRIICVLGMQDQAFPRRENPVAFDAMAQQWRAGDPRKGDEDRYLLLETLLCARDKLLFSFSGRSLKDNTECQPSVLLQELLDFIDARYVPMQDNAQDNAQESARTIEQPVMSQFISTLYPMQAFSWRNYAAVTEVPGSYDAWWCRVAHALRDAQGEDRAAAELQQSTWPLHELAATDDSTTSIELGRLIRFLQHPVKFFFNARLRIYLQEEPQSEDEEVFALNGLQSWALRNAMIAELLQTEDPIAAPANAAAGDDRLQNIVAAKGLLPHGGTGSAAYAQVQDNADDLLTTLQPYRGLQSSPQRIDLQFTMQMKDDQATTQEIHLSGQVASYLPGKGLLHYSPSNRKGKYVLAAWVEHLALCAMGLLASGEVTALHCRDGSGFFAVLNADAAREQLQCYMALYQAGLARPLPVFPETSLALVQDDGGKSARKCWEGDRFRNLAGDRDDPYVRLILRGSLADPLETSEVMELAEAIYGAACRRLSDYQEGAE
ncbi:MAG: exodeoxyribonuclease V subunit gamma [Gammaproteobacteria bacterium]|nr:exodeoxyribonuclease V subunit gamma [Gammaproteobacteria bacterium]